MIKITSNKVDGNVEDGNYDDELFCRMTDQEKVLSLIFIWDHCWRFSLSQIFDKPQAKCDIPLNLNSGFAEYSFTVVITTTPRCHCSTN